MAATARQIKDWFDAAARLEVPFMLVVCDLFNYEDYPVYIDEEKNPREVSAHYDRMDMQKVMECYDISLGWEAQSEGRVHNYGEF
jgi:hypothetical protein